MSDHNYYEVTNSHNQRELTIVNVALLVGKAPTKEKRIRIKVRDVLSGHPNMGAPDWLSAAQAFVSEGMIRFIRQSTLRVTIFDFSADNLFGAQGVKSPHCQMHSFEITEFGRSGSLTW